MGGILSLLCPFICFHFFLLCVVMNFSAGALLMGMKYCTAVQPHLGQVFSHFGVDSPRDGRILGINSGLYASC